MCVFQAVDKSFFFAGCFLVSIRKRKQEYKYKKYDIDNTASVEQAVVGSKSCSCCSYCSAQYEWKKHLCDCDEEFDSHSCNARSFVDDLGNCRVDTGIKEGVCDTTEDCTYISDGVTTVCSGIKCKCKTNQVNCIGSTSDCCGNAAAKFV